MKNVSLSEHLQPYKHYLCVRVEVFEQMWSLCCVSQALDGDFSDENRERCRVATTPLIEAVDNLSTFASNPEFASIPAQISHEVFKYLLLP